MPPKDGLQGKEACESLEIFSQHYRLTARDARSQVQSSVRRGGGIAVVGDVAHLAIAFWQVIFISCELEMSSN